LVAVGDDDDLEGKILGMISQQFLIRIFVENEPWSDDRGAVQKKTTYELICTAFLK